jgi:peptide-methionine (S)-S-oxide reductase
MHRNLVVLTVAALIGAAVAVLWVNGMFAVPEPPGRARHSTPSGLPPGHELATFGAGCFWCTEAVFQKVRGVSTVQSGYSGGSVKDPTYHEVCSGTTGHAEAIQIAFDPAVVPYTQLLEVFWRTHDPTTLNRQGNDVGTQYRSAVFYHSEQQRVIAERVKLDLDRSGEFAKPIVTEIVPYSEFFPAEDYHQNFFEENPLHPYCRIVISPKLKKLQKLFKDSAVP